MDHKEQRHEHHRHEREQHKQERKQHEHEKEQEPAFAPLPLWAIVLGVSLLVVGTLVVAFLF